MDQIIETLFPANFDPKQCGEKIQIFLRLNYQPLNNILLPVCLYTIPDRFSVHSIGLMCAGLDDKAFSVVQFTINRLISHSFNCVSHENVSLSGTAITSHQNTINNHHGNKLIKFQLNQL